MDSCSPQKNGIRYFSRKFLRQYKKLWGNFIFSQKGFYIYIICSITKDIKDSGNYFPFTLHLETTVGPQEIYKIWNCLWINCNTS